MLLARTRDGRADRARAGRRAPRRFGTPDSGTPLRAELEVHDPRAYAAMLRGSLGLALAHQDGAWSSPRPRRARAPRRAQRRPLRPLRRAAALAARAGPGGSRAWRAATPCAAAAGRSPRTTTSATTLFELFLDETMMYSAAIFERPTATLHEAQVAKLDRICRKLRLQPDRPPPGDRHRLGRDGDPRRTPLRLPRHDDDDLRRAARARDRARPRGGPGGSRHRAARATTASSPARYDKLVSIEMIEAVGWRDFGTYFATCSERLDARRPDAAAGDHDRRPRLRGREGLAARSSTS